MERSLPLPAWFSLVVNSRERHRSVTHCEMIEKAQPPSQNLPFSVAGTGWSPKCLILPIRVGTMREKLGNVQGRSWLGSKFEANLEYMRPCLKRSRREEKGSPNFLRVAPRPQYAMYRGGFPYQSPPGTLAQGFKDIPPPHGTWPPLNSVWES